MSAYGNLLSIVRYWHDRNPDYPQIPEAIVADYAHELAEQIRTEGTWGGPDHDDAFRWAADLIDPEVPVAG